MKVQLQLFGASSILAKEYYKKNKNKYLITRYSSSINTGKNIDDFFYEKRKNTNVIFFSHIKKKPKATIPLIQKVIDHCKKNNCQLIYISSVNAEFPKQSRYSNIKNICEKIVADNCFNYVRLGIVKSIPAFGPYKALISLKTKHFEFNFENNSIIYLTNIDSFTKCDLSNIKKNITIIDNTCNLNSFMKNPNAIVKLKLGFIIIFIRKLSQIVTLPNILDRALTLTAFKENHG